MKKVPSRIKWSQAQRERGVRHWRTLAHGYACGRITWPHHCAVPAGHGALPSGKALPSSMRSSGRLW